MADAPIPCIPPPYGVLWCASQQSSTRQHKKSLISGTIRTFQSKKNRHAETRILPPWTAPPPPPPPLSIGNLGCSKVGLGGPVTPALFGCRRVQPGGSRDPPPPPIRSKNPTALCQWYIEDPSAISSGLGNVNHQFQKNSNQCVHPEVPGGRLTQPLPPPPPPPVSMPPPGVGHGQRWGRTRSLTNKEAPPPPPPPRGLLLLQRPLAKGSHFPCDLSFGPLSVAGKY